MTSNDMDWVGLMDKARGQRGLNDAALGRLIGLSRSMLSQCRQGLRPLPLPAKLRLLHAMGRPPGHHLLLQALGPEFQQMVEEFKHEHDPTGLLLPSVRAFLDEELDALDAKARMAFFTTLRQATGMSEAEWGRALGLSPTQWKEVKHGDRPMPFWAKALVLEHVGVDVVAQAVAEVGARGGEA